MQKSRKRTLKNTDEKTISTQKEDIIQLNIAPKKQRKSEKKPNPSIRFNYSLGHFPHIDKSKSVRCKNEDCDKKTFVSCSICQVHLCICLHDNRNCFTDFHTIKK